MTYEALVPGILRRRYKRFLADVELADGTVVVAHCPNTGSMRAVNVPGCRVWLSPSTNPARKLAWTWELIELPRPDGGVALASVHTGRTNAIVEEALRAGRVEALAGYATLKREAKLEGARLDFRLDDPQHGTAFVEVKQVTLQEADGHGYFPDTVSERATRHLETLAAQVAAGHRAVLLFCVAHTGIRDVAPAAHLDPRYAETLRRVVEAGVEVLAYGCRVDRDDGRPAGISLDDRLPVSLHRQLHDAGVVD
ncbi:MULTISPECIES: DNA/RNA nuclease SfsA [Modicisalibacter]|uniref:Sugar fermentation stimulation protein homolog n=1 Tax=Modicisalibacter tunisiensis TaxID=390637 RepID=A0ABS7WWI5_9GAMM|nr:MULTISPECIES: DNA/RNA nuclease SfsA [Modicisalibacter]MBZ9540077.1 DNA/RNA nuclease SfsA [Modicisalibacter tunisiensis]MBZ9566529.1 DNA/RNA nuclease SfsA [Modicisalibacter tunisiensis]